MNKIEVKHTHIVINNYVFGDCPRLESFFKIYDPVYHIDRYKGIKYIPEEKKLILPRGLDVPFLESLFMTEAYVDYSYDAFDKNPDILIKYMPRDERQKQALKFILGLGDYSYTKRKSQLVLALNTGAGKTYVAISALAYTCIKGIIITSSIGWLEQWADKIVEYTDIKRNEIYMIQGVASITRLLSRKDAGRYKIYLASHNTLKSYGDANGWDKVGELFKYIKVGYKIYDEAHLNFDNMTNIDFSTNTFITLYLTATPARSDNREDQIYQLSLKNIPKIDLFDKENDPHTEYIAFKYNSRPNPMQQGSCVNKFGFNKMVYANYVVTKENFEYMMIIVLDMIRKVNGKALIYVATNNAIEWVYNFIISHYPVYINRVGIYTSIIDDEAKAQALSRNIILSTTKSCGAAMDIPGLKITVQLAEPIKSEVLSRQSLGRTRARDTYYLDIIDDGFPQTRNYYTSRLPMFDKYATECKEVRFRDDELRSKAEAIDTKFNSYIHPIIVLNKPPKGDVIWPISHL